MILILICSGKTSLAAKLLGLKKDKENDEQSDADSRKKSDHEKDEAHEKDDGCSEKKKKKKKKNRM